MKYKVSVIKKIAFLVMTMALAVAMVACQAATPKAKTQVAVGAAMGDIEFVEGAAPKTITLTSHFKATNPTYGATSTNTGVATVSVTGAVLTVTPNGVGTANVLVTATATADDEEGQASQRFTVKVTATPVDPVVLPDNERPTSLKSFEDVTLTVVDDPTEQIDLSGYFDDADDEVLTYTASLSNDMYATATVAESMLTITAVAAGTATITVTATDGKESVSREIDVTVNAESNKAPTRVAGLSRDVFVTVGGDANTLDLSLYFRDPEGAALTYVAESSNEMSATEVVEGSMLTITPVAAGTATITVTATDGELSASLDLMVTVSATPNVAPVVSTEIPDQSLEMDFMATNTLPDLSTYFSDTDSGPSALTYRASSDMGMYATATVDGSLLTITAVAAGDATITVTATDGAAEAMDTFAVMVTNPAVPTATSELPDQNFAHDDMEAKMFTLSNYFSKATIYNAMSSNVDVVIAGEENGVLTLTPVGAGKAVVTVTPSNSGGIGSSQTIAVDVAAEPAPPVVPPEPPTRGQLFAPIMDFAHDDDMARTFTLSDYFTGATSYGVTSTMPSVAIADEAGGVLTITPVSDGRTTVTVTAINDDGRIQQVFVVEVAEAPEPPNMPPRLKAGMMLDDFRMETTATENEEVYGDLDMYFEDPDGVTLAFNTMTSAPKIVAVYTAATEPMTAAGLDKAKSTTSSMDVRLRARTVGTAIITITVRDNAGMNTIKTFTVTVVSTNTVPTTEIPTDTLPDYSTADTRLKRSDTPKTAIDDKLIGDYFDDVNLGSTAQNDVLKLTAVYVDVTADVILGDGAIPGSVTIVDEDEAVATATVSRSTWDGNSNAKFTVTVTPKKAGSQSILIVATDLAGLKAIQQIKVRVNHKPQAYSAHPMEKDRETLETYKGFMNLNVAAGVTPSGMLALFAAGAGYFSDKDGSDDTYMCDFRTSEGRVATADKTAIVTMTSNALSVNPQNIGTMTITVWCNDGYEDSDEVTVPVEVDRGASIAS